MLYVHLAPVSACSGPYLNVWSTHTSTSSGSMLTKGSELRRCWDASCPVASSAACLSIIASSRSSRFPHTISLRFELKSEATAQFSAAGGDMQKRRDRKGRGAQAPREAITVSSAPDAPTCLDTSSDAAGSMAASSGNVLDGTGGGARNSTLVAGGIDLPANSLETSNDPDHISATKCPHCIEFSRRCEVINL